MVNAKLKFNHTRKVLLFSLLIFPIFNVYGKNMILELDDTYSFSKSIIQLEGRKVLSISGLSGHSAFVVDAIEIKKYPDSLQVIIHLRSNDKNGLSGSFSELIELASNVSTVTFGDKKTIIWNAN